MSPLPALQRNSDSRLVLLGASGFLANCLKKQAVLEGWNILSLGRPNFDLCSPECVPRLQAELKPTDSIVFLAGLTPEHGRNEETAALNVRMLENAASVLSHCGFAHFTYLSSDAVYAWGEDPITESSPVAPLDFYGTMHARREEIAGRLGEQSDRPTAILRPAAVHGCGDTHNAYGPNKFIRSILERGEIGLFGGGEEIRSHLWERDCARWILEALRTRWSGTLNIVPREALSFAELAGLLGGLNDFPVRLVYLPRKQPIRHRRFNPELRERLWPHLPPLTLESSLRLHWTEAAAGRHPQGSVGGRCAPGPPALAEPKDS
jgi:nucleoside-diphosphate-sugar epimerase